MKVKTVVRFCLMFVMVQLNDQKANGLPGYLTGINNDNSTTEEIGSTTETISSTTKGSSTAENIFSTTESASSTTEATSSSTENIRSTTPSNVTKLASDLDATDLKNTLQVLLLILNKKPDLATAKLVGRLINDIISQDPSTKQMHAKLLYELRKHVELKSLIDDLKLDSATTENPSQFELFPAILRNTIIEEVLKFHNLSDSAESVSSTENYSTDTPADDDFSTTTLEEIYTTDEQESESPSNNSENSTLESSSVTTTADNLHEKNSISSAITTSSSEISTTETMEVIPNEQPNQNVTIVNIIKKTLDRRNITKTFPSLSDNLLKMLNKYNMKYIRTYSEILEPLSPKEIKNKNQKNKGNWKQVCQSVAKYNRNKTTKKPKNKSKQQTGRKITKFANKTTSQQTASSSNSTNPSITSELFKKTTTEGISSVESTSIPSTNTMDNTITSTASTRKPSRPPGNRFELFTPSSPSLLSTQADSTYTEF